MNKQTVKHVEEANMCFRSAARANTNVGNIADFY
jgi:hypothetical protein